jgi:CHASE3 domain sensor protein
MSSRLTPGRTSSVSELPPVRGKTAAFAPVVLLTAFGFWALWLQQRAVNDSKLVQHTQAVSQGITEVAQDMRAAESGQRGFVITGGEEYLEPWIENRDSVKLDISRLAALTADNPRQQALVKALSPVVDARMARIAETIEVRRRGQADSAQAIVRTGEGRKLMDSALVIMRKMNREELSELEVHVSKEERDRRLTFIVLIAGVALSALFSLFVSFQLSDQAVHQWLISAELKSRNLVLQDQTRAHEETVRRLRERLEERDRV